MNIFMKEKQTQAEKPDLWLPRGKSRSGRDGLGVWDQQMQAILYIMDKQQGPTAVRDTIFNIM